MQTKFRPTRSIQRSLQLGWLFASWSIVMLATGCEMTAPMQVLKRPRFARGGPVRVAVAPVGGDLATAERLQEAIRVAQPLSMSHFAVMHPQDLQKSGGIQLVSYDGQPSDMAVLGAARRGSMDYVLQGHILSQSLDLPKPDPRDANRFQLFKPKEPVESITVRWIVTDVASGQRIDETNITVDRTTAEKEYPDLLYAGLDNDGRVLAASARKSWSLVAPTTEAQQARLALPWFMPGASQIRKGNGYARQGRWDLAEQEWQTAAHRHESNEAAWRNLSLAAVAREDFELAYARLSHANSRWIPGDPTIPTKVWIEQREREYKEAVNTQPLTQLASYSTSKSSAQSPTEGFSWSSPQPQVRPSDVPSSPPKKLDEMPWWTAIPFIPPPGWTWKQWWSQPLFF